LTVFLDVPIEISQELLTKRYADAETGSKDIHEGDVAYLEKCRRAALYVAQRDNWLRVDCMENNGLRSPENINRELVEIIGDTLKK
jgi:dTMP kinase